MDPEGQMEDSLLSGKIIQGMEDDTASNTQKYKQDTLFINLAYDFKVRKQTDEL